MAWIAVVDGGHIQEIGSGGYWPHGYIGRGDFTLAAGEQLVVVDRDPGEAGAAPRQLIYAGGSDAGPISRWVNVDKAGGAAVGVGTPAWWLGAKPAC
jgi:hypothetical protein